jgi:hypothetical protein
MSTSRFKTGDRVRLTGPIPNKKISVGSIGTVTEDSDIPYVSWDGYSPSVAAAVHYRLELIEEEIELKRGDLVWISDTDMDCSSKHERIFVTKIEGCKYPYVCVSGSDENEFHSGQEFTTTAWRYAKKVETQEVQEAKEYTIEELHKIVGHEFKIKK